MEGFIKLSIDSLFLIITSITLVIIIIYSLIKGRKTPVVYSYITFFAILTLWVSLMSFERIVEYFGFMSMGNVTYYMQYWTNIFLPSSFLLFCLLYTESSVKLRSILISFSIAIVSFFSIIMLTEWDSKEFIFLNDGKILHAGFYYLIFMILSTFEYIAGTFLLLKELLRKSGIERKRSIVIIVIINSAILSYAASVVLSILLKIDTSFAGPLILLVSTVFFSFALFKYGFQDIRPIALRSIVDSLDESLVAVDNNNKIIDFNNSIKTNFLLNRSIKNGSDIYIFIDIIRNIAEPGIKLDELLKIISDTNINNVQREFSTSHPGKKYYKVSIKPIRKRGRGGFGRIITFHDITDYKILTEDLAEKNSNINSMNEELTSMNEELTAVNIQLREYSEAVENLTLLNERNRIARDVHDTLGHTLTLLIMLIKASKIKCSRETDDLEETLTEALNVAQEGMKELRKSITGLSSGILEKYDIITALGKLVEDSKSLGIKIELSVFGEENFNVLSDKGKLICLNEAIFKVCKEALTNSLKHGKATVINIILKFNTDEIRIFINDNGLGCKDIMKGYGLTGMEDRLRKFRGKVKFGSDGEKGFNINIKIPVDGDTIYD